ncbi:MAG TPA: esterase-like activity of phytase family protein, partial [Burkholderiaceae bacterium]|nr:esterase-like activity of phytase family protein [Burkholderiaceae bacterium]
MLRSGFIGLLLAGAGTVSAQTVGSAAFINGLALPGNGLDLSAGDDVERRLGYFSDLYYDAGRAQWWGLSDRGPGGGTLPYETRVQRFTLEVAANGVISGFKVAETIKFSRDGSAMNGLAPPSPGNVLGNSFDPEGFVVNPANGRLLVSDEYGPSLYEFDRQGKFVRAFTTPANLIPRNAVGVPNFAGDTGNTLGKRSNRGFEGLAISPDGHYAYAVLQSPMLEEGGA